MSTFVQTSLASLRHQQQKHRLSKRQNIQQKCITLYNVFHLDQKNSKCENLSSRQISFLAGCGTRPSGFAGLADIHHIHKISMSHRRHSFAETRNCRSSNHWTCRTRLEGTRQRGCLQALMINNEGRRKWKLKNEENVADRAARNKHGDFRGVSPMKSP